jgi:hypothetical protein
MVFAGSPNDALTRKDAPSVVREETHVNEKHLESMKLSVFRAQLD